MSSSFPASAFDEDLLSAVLARNSQISSEYRQVRGGDPLGFTVKVEHMDDGGVHTHDVRVPYVAFASTPELALAAVEPLLDIQPETEEDEIRALEVWRQHGYYLGEFVRAAHERPGHPESLCQADNTLRLWEALNLVTGALTDPTNDEGRTTKAYLQGATHEQTIAVVRTAVTALKELTR
ncbi:hypothetical protein [Microbacterium sp. 77mftsu3.1]|uniref:hypothetical protein n=1 Tax=Microbacterium sp. 77mftsu3.1 TaxID=1761802 RepID=UPI000371E3FF|nr:hypothetical protein [Microbacterium sp. 77mftsu3.1]SDH55904.1 hypothetical protein SAMN04488590_3575 [Microbacterium sp. 77mftsu3.1]